MKERVIKNCAIGTICVYQEAQTAAAEIEESYIPLLTERYLIVDNKDKHANETSKTQYKKSSSAIQTPVSILKRHTFAILLSFYHCRSMQETIHYICFPGYHSALPWFNNRLHPFWNSTGYMDTGAKQRRPSIESNELQPAEDNFVQIQKPARSD
jgi:hypothetical protein